MTSHRMPPARRRDQSRSVGSSNTLSVFLHVSRAIYSDSYCYNPNTWLSGLLLFFLLMTTAFIGYVLPLGTKKSCIKNGREMGCYYLLDCKHQAVNIKLYSFLRLSDYTMYWLCLTFCTKKSCITVRGKHGMFLLVGL